MKLKPDMEEAGKLVAEGQYRCIPISCELYSDQYTPLGVLRKLKNVSRYCYMLESIEDNQKWGRYTFLGYDPKLELTCINGKLTIKNGSSFTVETGHPGEYIRQVLRENKSPKLPGLPSFTGGLVGYFSYDYMKYAEPALRLDAEDKEGFKDVDLMLFDKVIAFDHFRQKIILIVNIRCEDLETEYHRAELELQTMCRLLEEGQMQKPVPGKLKADFRALFDREHYCSMVEKAKHYIHEGDIFQVVLSNQLEADFEGSLLDTYRVLRTVNPSPYMFYFSSDDMEIAGASPETLVKLEDRTLHTFPLAGTLSGAPKIRACEIINELEDNKRGIYGGAIGYIDFAGNLDTCIAIRIAYKKNGKVFVRSGAGIVADSVPEKEYEECINKAKAVVRALELAQEEIRNMKPDRIILSPGPGFPKDAGICVEAARELGKEIPILGVGLGHQSICEAFGATVSYAKQLMHGKQSKVKLDTECPLFRGMHEEIQAARYHSLAAVRETMPDCLKITAETEDGEIMAVMHRSHPIYGVQFHPESILTPDGAYILENFIA